MSEEKIAELEKKIKELEMEINQIIEWIDEDIKYQEKQLTQNDFDRDKAIHWRIIGMKNLLRKIHIHLKTDFSKSEKSEPSDKQQIKKEIGKDYEN